jgi:hypothetical protein
MPFTRPTGFYTTRFVDNQKRNSYEMLKSFLLNTNSGRTDVLFVGERNTYFEDTSRPTALVGGLADGIAKSILGKGRTLYATPIFLGNHANAPYENFNPATPGSWTAASNTVGLGRCLVGSRYVFDTYFYTTTNGTTKRLPVNAEITSENTTISAAALSPFTLSFVQETTPGFTLGSSGSSIRYATQDMFVAGYGRIKTNTGPIAYPYFLGKPHKHVIPTGISLPFEVASVANVPGFGDVALEIYMDSTTIGILSNPLFGANAYVNFTPGTPVSTILANPIYTLSSDGTKIIFNYSVDNLLIPLLSTSVGNGGKGWNVCLSGCTGNEDVYKLPNGEITFEGVTRDLWVFNRSLPHSYGGQGNEFLFPNKLASDYFTLWKGRIVSQNHLQGLGSTSSIASLYNGEEHRALPPTLHYTQVQWTGIAIGVDRPPYNFEPLLHGTIGPGSTTFGKYNLATQPVATPFIWKIDWDVSNPTYHKNKYIELDTKLGSFYSSHTLSPFAITLNNPVTKNSLYTTSNFKYKVKYLNFWFSGNGYPKGILPLTISGKTGAGAWTHITNDTWNTSSFNFGDSSVTRAYREVSIDLTNPANQYDKYALSFTGFNHPTASTKLTGNQAIVHHWGENANDLNGISFSHLYMSEDFRSGDVAYALQSEDTKLQFKEIFHTILERQKSNTSGNKVVIIVNALRFDNANPGDGYVSGWAQSYLHALKTYILDLANEVGITNQEVVVWFIGPTLFGKVDYWSSTEEDYNVTGATTTSFAKSKFVMVGSTSTNPIGGLLKPNWPAWSNPEIFAEVYYIPNAVYTQSNELSEFISLNSTITSSLAARNVYFYDSGEVVYNHTNSVEGFLLNGELLVTALGENTSTSYFAPPWVETYGRYLKYTSDPVNQTPFEFLTPSVDPVDIRAYLASFYGLVAQGNTQAKQTLAYHKHKILQ